MNELKRARRLADVTLAELSSKSGISTTMLSNIENDLRIPTPEQRAAIERAVQQLGEAKVKARAVNLALGLKA